MEVVVTNSESTIIVNEDSFMDFVEKVTDELELMFGLDAAGLSYTVNDKKVTIDKIEQLFSKVE